MNVGLRLAASAALALAIVGGCASDKLTDGPSKASRGVRNRTPDDEGAKKSARPEALAPWNPYGDEAQAKPEGQAAKAEEDKRDYSADLLAAIGNPVSCLKPRVGKDAPSEIAVSLEVSVVETGLVTRGYARSSQLDSAELECVQARLTSLRLPAPIKGAPRTVTASLELKQKPADKKPGAQEEEAGDDSEKEEKEKEEKEVAEREPEPQKEPDEPRDEPQRDEPQRDEPQRDEPANEDAPRDDTPREGAGDYEAEPQPPE